MFADRLKIARGKWLHKISSLLDDSRAGRWGFVSPLCMLILLIIGIGAIYSALSYYGSRQWHAQVMWAILGAIIYFAAAKIDYAVWYNQAHWIYYCSVLLLLLLWSPFGERRFGAVRWIKICGIAIQPSEPAKIGFLIMLAAMMARTEITTFLNSIKNLAKFFLVFCIPAVLVFSQPDLGSALVFPVVFFAMLYVSNLSKKFFACILATALVLAAAVVFDICAYRNFLDKKHLNDEIVMEKYEDRSLIPLRDYQRDRIVSFIFPSAVDPNGVGISWNLRQSLIAVGTGGLSGKGFGNGTQAKLGYLPKSVAANDFVFSVIAEERGFVGALVVILSYILIIWNGLRTANCARDRFGTYLCVGISMLFLVHICINIGMTIGLMPITGIPLPFLSYGGSFLLICCFSNGIIQSVHRYRNNFT